MKNEKCQLSKISIWSKNTTKYIYIYIYIGARVEDHILDLRLLSKDINRSENKQINDERPPNQIP